MRDLSAHGASVLMPSTACLGRLMPMFLHLDLKGNVVSAGPTLVRVFEHFGLSGAKFFDLFQVRRPTGISSQRKLSSLVGERIQLIPRCEAQRPLTLRGLCLELPEGGGYLFNLSFGIGVVDAVRDLHLTEADFAPTDLAIELLYLVEAKSAIMHELRDLNLRLQGAKLEAEQQALTDTLTGLRNRRALESVMTRLIKGGASFALMHLDLDYFKQVNDTLGHAAGDFVLRRVAEILNEELRASDTLARVGGDEFVVVLHGHSDIAQLLAIAERIIAALGVPIIFEGQPCRISGSIGISCSWVYEQATVEQMHADADAALYASKHAGRSRAKMFSPDHAGALQSG